MVVENYIKDLLFRVDCVVIPEFGGFIMQYESSYIHPVKNIFQPPKKRIAFNESLKSNDGLLIHEIQVGEDISKEEANGLVADFVENILNELKERELIVLDEIGTFQLNKEQKIQFEADSKANYLDESFGLTEVYFKPIIREEEISDTMKRVHPSQARQAVRRAPVQKRSKPVSSTEKELAQEENVAEQPNNNQEVKKKDKSVEPKSEKSSNKNVVFIALPILLLLFAAGSALFLMQNQDDNSSIQEASVTGSIGDSGDVVASNEEALPEEKVVESEVEEIVTPEEVVEEEVETAVAPTISSDDNRYFIIGGSFGELVRAQKMANSVTGAKIIEGNGLYRVAVASFSSKNKAFSSLNDYKGEFGSDIWVLIK